MYIKKHMHTNINLIRNVQIDIAITHLVLSTDKNLS